MTRPAATDGAVEDAALGLEALAAARDAATAGTIAARLLRESDPSAVVVVADRRFPPGEPWRLSDGACRELEETGRARLEPVELPAEAGARPGEAVRLAPGVILLRAGLGGPAPDARTRTIGSLLALVAETDALRRRPEPAEDRQLLERMAAFGRSMLTINHDVNNPLCAIGLNAQLLGLALESAADPRLRERVRAIEENTHKIQDLMRRLVAAKQAARLGPSTLPAIGGDR